MEIDVFVSHHTSSSLHIVKAIVNQLEANGVRCWYAPRDTEGSYAGSIARAINACSVFLLILNKPASESVHVLNEIDMATKRLTKKEPVTLIPFHVADNDIADDAQYYLGRLHWIDAMTPPMYQRIDELVATVLHALGKECKTVAESTASAPAQYRLVSKAPQARSVFAGRDDLLREVQSKFSAGNRILFLEGIGGIGKSELAKQYALANTDAFRQILFVTYVDSLQKLVCDPSQIEIEHLEQEPEESDADFFRRKLQVFRTLADEHTLLIVDNFDVDDDPDLAQFLEGTHKVIFTTRNAHPGYPSVPVKAIPDMEALLRIFELNYGMPVEAEDCPWLEQLFERIEYHTYTIELLAKQMEASFLTAREMLELLEAGRTGELTETVAGRRDQKTAFGHICSVFSMSNLTPEEQQILRELSLMGLRGVPANRFREWAGLDSFNLVNRLIKRSWIRREAGQRLSLHPLVNEVVREILMPDAENCRDFLMRMAYFAFMAWFRPVKENMAVANNILSVAEYFKPYDVKLLHVWVCLPVFLWQVGAFDDSIRLERIVYDTCLAALGEASIATGYVAKALAGCYFNSRQVEESIFWYKQGLKCMELAPEPPGEDLAMSYEKVARCYTWEYEQDFDKAEAYMRKALDIRLQLKEAIARGETCPTFSTVWEALDMDKVMERLAETYMEMGRMYQAMGEYEKALEYNKKHQEILLSQNGKDVSGLAYDYYDQGVSYYHLALRDRAAGKEASAAQLLQLALENFQKALELNMKMRGEVAMDTIENEEYLADTYAALGRYGDASNYYMAVIAALEKLLGKNCPRIEAVKKKMCF